MFFEGVVFAWERPLPKHKLSIELSIYMFYQEERSNVWRAVLEVSICIHLLQLQHTYCQIASYKRVFWSGLLPNMGPHLKCVQSLELWPPVTLVEVCCAMLCHVGMGQNPGT